MPMTGHFYTTIISEALNPPETTITEEMTVTYSTIENDIEKVDVAYNSIHVEKGWTGWGIIRVPTSPRMNAHSSPKERIPKSTQGLEEEVSAFEKLLFEATQQLKKMLSGMEDSTIIAIEILAHLDRTEKVLLSCTTVVVGQDFATMATCQESGDWAEEEKVDFCHRFNSFMREQWTMKDILGRWEKFLKDKIEVWQPEACCTEVWDVGYDLVDYSQILKDLGHKHAHRSCEARKLEMKTSSQGVIKRDLMHLKVSFLCC